MARKVTWNTPILICLIAALVGIPGARMAAAQTSSGGSASTAKAHTTRASASSAGTHKTSASRNTTSRTVASKTAAKTTVARLHSTTVRSNRTSVASFRTPAATTGVRTSAVYRGRTRSGVRMVLAVRRTRRTYERFTGNSFADNLSLGDVTAGEDPVVRAAAVDALGNMNGTALAIDPSNGRILAMVNQKVALSSGAEPCSTIKLAVSLAALDEGLITRDTPVNLGGHYTMTLTTALAKSINPYFETLGRMLGFERVKHYANEFGLGELAGYNIEGEQLGTYPDTELPAAEGGVGRMCSFGEGISMTPLQLGALTSAIANGGTLYYLQHPQFPEEVADFVPKVKRVLDIAPLIPEMQDGMEGAVDYGTARSLRATFHEFPVFGKTGTCSDNGTRYGWFAAYADTPRGKIVTVIFIEGGRPSFGPKAAELTGEFYRGLWDRNYFESKTPQMAWTGQTVRTTP
jgi:penicillin-binding protein 2